jgi:hypothetical protein
MELLYDSDGRVASAALWSLLKSCEARLANALFGAARNGARCREGLDYSFALTLLIEAALLDHRIAGRVEDLRRSLVDEDPENPLILDCESALRATEPENPQRERGDDGE